MPERSSLFKNQNPIYQHVDLGPIFTVGVFSAFLLSTPRQLYWFLRSQIYPKCSGPAPPADRAQRPAQGAPQIRPFSG